MSEEKKPCPLCKKIVDWETNKNKPFCSERCKTLDLGNWATESYKIPGRRLDETEIELETKNNKNNGGTDE